MSWDFYMVAPILKADGGSIYLSDYHANYTYNVAPMFFDAIGPDGIRTVDGLTGEEALRILRPAIAKMKTEFARYRAMDPPNGWGNYDGALALLIRLESWCFEVPSGKLVVR